MTFPGLLIFVPPKIPLAPSGGGVGQIFLGLNQSHIYPNMCAKYGCVSKKREGTDTHGHKHRQRDAAALYSRLAGYPASLGFPSMHPFHAICTNFIIAITYLPPIRPSLPSSLPPSLLGLPGFTLDICSVIAQDNYCIPRYFLKLYA